MAADVFVSYSSTDKPQVLALIDELRSRGITVWVDQGGIDGAAMWSEEIVEAIEGCKVLMLMISSSSVSSHNVVKEVALSSERKKHILPVYLEQVELPKALKYPLAGIQHVDFFSSTEQNLSSVVRSLTKLGVSLVTAHVAGGPMPKLADTKDEGPKLVAVLPFDNISPEKDSDYFSDGLTEELIANLSKLSEIKVVSRTTTMQYKETKKDTKTIAAELKVHYILEGSVRKIGDNLRITAQLVEVATDAHIWAETYKGTMADVFDIQERVAKEIADALRLKLTPAEKAVLTKRATIVPEAYDCCLRARPYLYRASQVGLGYAKELFERAIELDPRYAEAYSGLGMTYARTYHLYQRDEQLLEQAQDLALKALMYDQNLADAYVILAQVHFAHGETEDGIVAAQRATELAPDNYLGFWALGRAYFAAGQLKLCRDACERALRLNPNDYISGTTLDMCYRRLGEEDKARAVQQQLVTVLSEYLNQFPDDVRARMSLAVSAAGLGQIDIARQALLKALEQSPNDALTLVFAACVYSRMGDLDLAVNTLKAALNLGWKDIEWMKRDPDLDPIRTHPGYIELMKNK